MSGFQYSQTKNSSKIGDASFIGLECESGDVEDCNDRTERAPPGCNNVLILSENESKCGSKCNASSNQRLRRSSQKRKKNWTKWIRKLNTSLIIRFGILKNIATKSELQRCW